MKGLKGIRSTMVMLLTAGYMVLAAYFGMSLLVLPLGLLIRPFNRRLFFERVIPFVFGSYWYSSLYILEYLNGTKVRIYGEMPRMADTVLVLCNHKCDLDYCYLWAAIARTGSAVRVGMFKAVLKSAIKAVPVFGWGCKACGSLYLTRSWEQDKAHMKRWGAAMTRDKIPMWLMLYPEGTRYTERRRASSEKVAKEKGVAPYQSELLLPRTKGMVLLVRSLDQYITTILDMTIAYTKRDGTLLKGSDLGTSVLKKAFSGDSPIGTVHMHFKYLNMADLPSEDEALTQWTMDLWRNKDKLLHGLQTSGSFPEEPLPAEAPSRISLLARVLFFVILICFGAYMFCVSRWGFYYHVVAVCFGIGLAVIDPPEW